MLAFGAMIILLKRACIGNASNVDHFSDILALLILQNGGDRLIQLVKM